MNVTIFNDFKNTYENIKDSTLKQHYLTMVIINTGFGA